ncbi:MAG: hypothetical protein IPI15_18935 [Saprospiraceae bacterium]|nr:hypothetical protein [Candidatus Brachybacter algidus]MBK7605599.1 hypothetical protein [Candidatus Brachybacter algidus]
MAAAELEIGAVLENVETPKAIYPSTLIVAVVTENPLKVKAVGNVTA